MKISNKTNKQNDVWSKTDGESDKKINIDNLKMFRLLGGDIPDDGILTNTLAAALIDADGHADITDGYTSIGDSAFDGASLTSVTIPDSVTSIGNDAFLNCTGLTSVTIPDSVTSIGNQAFQNCTGLTSVTIPDSVTSIGYGAFVGNNLISVTIGNSVTSIGNYAFAFSGNLTSVTLYEGIATFGSFVFLNTPLSKVTVYYTDDKPDYDSNFPAGAEITYEQSVIEGDENGDGVVNVLDIVAAFNNGNKHLIPSIVDTILGR
jgi:hypothetical protein